MVLDPKNLPPFSHTDDWLRIIREFLNVLSLRKKTQYNRRVSIGDLLTERSDNAAMYGFGEGTTMYDNVLVLGEVTVGRQTWIGPGCILDGSGGGLEIGDFCSISSGGSNLYPSHRQAFSFVRRRACRIRADENRKRRLYRAQCRYPDGPDHRR